MKNHALLASLCLVLAACAAPPPTSSEVKIIDLGDNGDYPFSDAAVVGNTLFLSGALGIVPGQSELVEGGIAAETSQAMDNLKLYTEASGFQMSNIIKCNVFLVDMAEWAAFNDVYRTYFSKPFPARTAVAVSGLALDARVEVECIAAK